MSSVRSSSPAPSASSLNKEKLQWKANGEWNEHYFKSIFQHALLYLAETKQGAFPKVGPNFWDKVQKEFCRDKSLVAVSSQNFYKQVTKYTTEVTKYLGLSENGDISTLIDSLTLGMLLVVCRYEAPLSHSIYQYMSFIS